MHTATLYRVLTVLMVGMAAALVLTHTTLLGSLALPAAVRAIVGVAAGLGIGWPRRAADSGDRVDLRHRHQDRRSLSLLVSLPTMLVAFARYSRDSSFMVLRNNIRFVIVPGLGSITGAMLGGLLLRRDP